MSDKNLETAQALRGLTKIDVSPRTMIYSALVVLATAGRRADADRLRQAWLDVDASGRTVDAAKFLLASAAFNLIAPADDEDGPDPQIAVGVKE
jgi:hypothetical protein